MSRSLQRIDQETASQLVSFASGQMSRSVAVGQLEGAVAAHNMLVDHRVAYVADEVGMGKTYVALGVMALLRFFNPNLRVLYIAPRENIQRKWQKELGNFAAVNWRHRDQRVRSLQDGPAMRTQQCDSLYAWAAQVARDPACDVFLRMTMFSLGLADEPETWKAKRDALLALAPVIDRGELDLRHRDKERFKDDYAIAINKLLPHYDLVIVDEAHNLKHGRHTSASRNRILGLVLGSTDHPRVQRRFDRVLLLSATPLESDFRELYNQLDLFGFGSAFQGLRGDIDESEKRAIASRILIRRLTELRIAGEPYTKNMYRREWRAGGVRLHDEPLEIPGTRQRLVVALIQKKVAEILNDAKFNASFQIGMLSSFESFAQTARVDARTKEETDSTFDAAADQTDDERERQGVDTASVDAIARSYEQKFKQPLPHPKMDAIVDSIAPRFGRGEKTLVFVRRVRTVAEMAEKLRRRYDQQLRARLEHELGPELAPKLHSIWETYEKEHLARRRRAAEAVQPDGDQDENAGGHDSFFAWFFRGEGPPDVLSGAAFQKNRLRGDGSVYSTFFEDNYVADMLGWPDDPLPALAARLERPEDEVRTELRALASSRIAARSRQDPAYQELYRAFQEAALHLLHEHGDERAAVALSLVAGEGRLARIAPLQRVPNAERFLGVRTFFTELRRRPDLRDRLWPRSAEGDARRKLRDRETRRELLSSAARLGHAFIDLWVLAVRRLNTLELRRRDEDVDRFLSDYLDLLERQQREGQGFAAFDELSAIADQHELLLNVSMPEARTADLRTLPTLFGRAFARQDPVGAMWGGVNATLVRQFRMPGYPFALITTDVLQEGEDLHTFCDRIVHYGISWTPSSMEQRTGRIDRIGSLVHRRLERMDRKPEPEELLQVHYPYLADTVEKLQVDRVLERMNAFMRLTHHGLAQADDDSRVHVKDQILRTPSIAPIDKPLESAYPVHSEHLRGARLDVRGPAHEVATYVAHFEALCRKLEAEIHVEWEGHGEPTQRWGTVYVRAAGDRLRRAPEPNEPNDRYGPFTVQLRSSPSTGATLLHAVSPIATDGQQRAQALVGLQQKLPAHLAAVRLCESASGIRKDYLFTAESDVLFRPDTTSLEELIDLIERVTVVADLTERTFFHPNDAQLPELRDPLDRRTRRG